MGKRKDNIYDKTQRAVSKFKVLDIYRCIMTCKTRFSSMARRSISVPLRWTSSIAENRVLYWFSSSMFLKTELQECLADKHCFSSRNCSCVIHIMVSKTTTRLKEYQKLALVRNINVNSHHNIKTIQSWEDRNGWICGFQLFLLVHDEHQNKPDLQSSIHYVPSTSTILFFFLDWKLLPFLYTPHKMKKVA